MHKASSVVGKNRMRVEPGVHVGPTLSRLCDVLTKQRRLSFRRCQDSTYMFLFLSSHIKIELRVH
jgi:hypothetical protein